MSCKVVKGEKKPGRPDDEDAANLAAQAGPVNTMALWPWRVRPSITLRPLAEPGLPGAETPFTPHGAG
jgi:hypothetical protein